MTTDDRQDELIAYVEHQLSPDARASFEQKLARSPELRGQLATMQLADESLKRSFAVPGNVKVDFEAARQAAGAGAAARRNPWLRYAGLAGAAVAAVVTIVAVLQWMPSTSDRRVATVGQLYDAQVQRGFVPDHVCKDDADFIEYTRTYLGVALLAQNDSSVQIVGWVYASSSMYRDLGLSGAARIILAKVDGREVILLLDPTNVAGPKPDPAAQSLNVFETTVGGVDIFEITPLDTPVVSKKFKRV